MSIIMKTLKLFLIISLLYVTCIAKAQDVIVKKDISTILCKVTKINNSEIEYKKWSNLDGPTYAISIYEVVSIYYQNGEIENFTDSKQQGYMKRNGYGLELNGRELSYSEVLNLVGEDNYYTYISARQQIYDGRVLTVMFIITMVGTVGLAVSAGANNDSGLLGLACITGAVANISGPLMCILKGIGKGRMNWVADEYNRKNRGYSFSYSLSPSIMTNKTPQLQNTYGLGLTFSMNF